VPPPNSFFVFSIDNREQNTLEEGAEQLALAFDQYGVNFIDTYV
jgi:hypothetical protein